ncbi:MAG: hypothetical protein ACE5MH_01225 [Terriglobia bacterium]
MQCNRWEENCRLTYVGGFLFLQLSFGLGIAAQHPSPDPDLGPRLTPRQQREWLHWNHRRVQRDIRRLVELAEELDEQAGKLPVDRLGAAQRESLEVLREKIALLSQEFAKTDPHLLPLGIIGHAKAIEAEAKSLREFFEETDRKKQKFPRLHRLTQQIQKRAKRVADRLRNP